MSDLKTTRANYNEVDGIVWLKPDHNSATNHASRSLSRDHPMDLADGERIEDTEDESEEGGGSEIILNDDDVWDDTLLIQMYEESQKAINDAIRESFNNNNNKGGSSGTPKKNSTTTTVGGTVNKEKAKSAKANNNKKMIKPKSECNNNNNKVVQRAWKEGDFCRLNYLEDNIEYEATVVTINPADQSCLVRYIGYENEEVRKLSDLRPSLGDYFRQMQIKMAIQDGYGVKIVEKVASEAQSELDSSTKASCSSSSVPIGSPSGTKEVPNSPRVIPPPPPALFAEPSGDREDDALASMLMSWYMTGYHTGYYQAQKELKKKCTCQCGK